MMLFVHCIWVLLEDSGSLSKYRLGGVLDDLCHVDVLVFKEKRVLIIQRFYQVINGYLPRGFSLHNIELLFADAHDHLK